MNNVNINDLMQRLNQLKQTGGDPSKQIQQLLNSGRVTQEQYNNAVRTAQQLRKMLGI